MRTIWKYELRDDSCAFEIPSGGIVRAFDIDNKTNLMCIWVEVETTRPIERRVFRIVGTGHDINRAFIDNRPIYEPHYVGTLQQGVFVWHLYEEKLALS